MLEPKSCQTGINVAQLVEPEVVADERRVFDGFRGDLERLHGESNDKAGDHNRGDEGLYRRHPARLPVSRRRLGPGKLRVGLRLDSRLYEDGLSVGHGYYL